MIKYVPYVSDSKRAMDEYTSEIMMGGKNTIVMHNTCEDSLLASPIILDLCILAEMCQRITYKVQGDAEFQQVRTSRWWPHHAVCITGPLWRESTDERWIPPTKGPVMQIFDVSCAWTEKRQFSASIRLNNALDNLHIT